MNTVKTTRLILVLIGLAAALSAKSDDKPTYLDIRPSYHKDSLLAVKPNHNPFRKATLNEERILNLSDNSAVANQIIANLGENAVGGVINSSNGIPTVIICGEVYALNDEIRLHGEKGANRPVMEEFRLILRSLARGVVLLEAMPTGINKSASSVPVKLPLDEFFDDKQTHPHSR